MTISSTTRTAGPYNGTGVVGTFPFSFKVLNANEVAVYKLQSGSTLQTELLYGTDFSVALNSNQDSSPGGSITLLPSGTVLSLGSTLYITSEVPNLQLLDLTNQGGFYPDTINDALDRATIQIQQLQTQVDRAVKTEITDTITPDELLTSIRTSETNAAASASSALSSLNTFRGTYYGALASDPSTDPLGNPVSQGDFYFNTTAQVCRARASSSWVDVGAAVPVTIRVQRFTGDGTTTVFTLTNAASFENAVEVFINGVAQVPGIDYTLSGNPLVTITFTTAPPAGGTNNIYVRITNAVAGQTVNDGSITTNKLAANAVTAEKIADGAITPAKLASDSTFRNRFINGKMEISQRGTSFSLAAGTSSLYSVDRLAVYKSSPAAVAITQEACPTGITDTEFSQCLKIAATTGTTSISAGDYLHISQKIEGYNIRDLFGKPFTISFWVQATATGTYAVSLRNSALTRAYVASYTINASNTWEYKTITVSAGLPATGVWDTTTGTGLEVSFTLLAGSTYQTSVTSWQTGNFIAPATTINAVATTGNTFYITGVQLEKGSYPSKFDHRPIGDETALCQRYFQLTPNITISVQGYTSGAGGAAYAEYSFPVQMRATPTVENNFSGHVNVSSTSVYPSPNHMQLRAVASAGGDYACSYNASRPINAEL